MPPSPCPCDFLLAYLETLIQGSIPKKALLGTWVSCCLYSGLIVLFCNTQRLYSSLRTKSASEEAWGIGKAVGLATALQLVCIYLSRLNLISCFRNCFHHDGQLPYLGSVAPQL